MNLPDSHERSDVKAWSTRDAFLAYAMRGSRERRVAAEFLALLDAGGPVYDRVHRPGHFTGSAWVVDRAGERVLLTHHRKLGLWLQLGGHADGDADLRAVALKEAYEESGLERLAIEPEIFDLDRHAIPSIKDDTPHDHYDVRFVVWCVGSEDFAVSDESHALAWRSIAELAGDVSADESVRRMAGLWLQRG